MAHHSKKATHNSSNEGVDNDPPHPKIDISRKLPVDKKRKKIVGQGKSLKLRVRTWMLSLIWIALSSTLINLETVSNIVAQWT
jgi:hypothetical protein